MPVCCTAKPVKEGLLTQDRLTSNPPSSARASRSPSRMENLCVLVSNRLARIELDLTLTTQGNGNLAGDLVSRVPRQQAPAKGHGYDPRRKGVRGYL